MKVRFGVREDPVSRARADRIAVALRAALRASEPDGDDEVSVVAVTEVDDTDDAFDPSDLVAALRVALVSGECDAVIHDASTLSPKEPIDLEVVAYLPGREARMALCSDAGSLDALAPQSRVICPDVRVAAQVARLREDVTVEVDPRDASRLLRRQHEDDVAAVIVAAADLLALGESLEDRRLIEADELVPAAGQGAIVIEARADAPEEIASILGALDDPDTRSLVATERAVMSALGAVPGDPVSVYVERRGRDLHLRVRVTNASGTLVLNDSATVEAKDSEFLAENSAKLLKGRGAVRLMSMT